MQLLRDHRVIALDVRWQRFGFAVFEGPEHLLDWGVRNFSGVPLREKVAQLIFEWEPYAIALIKPRNSRVRQNVMIIRTLAKSCHLPISFIGEKSMIAAFPPLSNKYERARHLAESLPELAAQVPKNRKPWESEHYQLSIFDAAAVGSAYFSDLKRDRAESLRTSP